MTMEIWFTWPVLAIQLGIALISLLFWRRYLSPISDIPGPFAASFTRLWHVRRVIVGDQSTALLNLHRKHGHFVRISHDEVSVSHPEVVRKILITPLEKAPWYKLLAFPDWRFQTPLSTTDPKAKTERSRQLASGFLASNILRSSEPAMDVHISRLKTQWLDRHAASGEPFDLDKFLTYTAFDVVGEVMFSRPFGFVAAGVDIGGAISSSLGLNALVAWGGWYRWLFDIFLTNPFVTWLDVLPMGHLAHTAQRTLLEREKRGRENKNEDGDDILGHWLKRHRERPDKLSFRDIRAVTATNVGAGSDTVSCAVQSFVYHMIRCEGAWCKAREEMRRVGSSGGSSTSVMENDVVSYADTQKLPYLQACIREALRIFPSVPMGLPRVAPQKGLAIGDRFFPEGTIVSVNPYVLHRSREVWGYDADDFRPERWLEGEEGGEGDGEDKARRERCWIPWGMGYASCPGQAVARIEVAKMAATLVRDYDIEQVDKTQNWQWKAYFSVVPHSWPVYISKRSG